MKKTLMLQLIICIALIFSACADDKKNATDTGSSPDNDNDNGLVVISDDDNDIQNEKDPGHDDSDKIPDKKPNEQEHSETDSVDNDTEVSDGMDECEEITQSAEMEVRPVDIVLVVDNSASMKKEATEVQENINQFSSQIIDSGVDAIVVLISARLEDDDQGICVTPPLGNPNITCPEGDDTNLPTFLHVDEGVSSSSSLKDIVETYDQWKQMRRDRAQLHFIIVSDDDSGWDVERFYTELGELTDPVVNTNDIVVHAIVSEMTKSDAEDMDPPHPCKDWAADEGKVYKELVDLTGGVKGDLCQQEFDPVFDQLATEITDSAFACEWKIPEQDVVVFDKYKVYISFTDDEGKTTEIDPVESVEECKEGEYGWYYDNIQDPEYIKVCPTTCTWMKDQKNPAISIKFGCKTWD